MRHYTLQKIEGSMRALGIDRAVIKLAQGDTAWNPASTKPERCIRGPATVTYTRFSDGGWRAEVSD